ncbi:hypothetical protein [Streptomyces sp. AS02]|uniref:hypothetical protein n=1 Tax=Streptomyces sp. AS02 TaxID=2938946 RepID=UPI00201FE948|nr:hypothetical protein [Streptomyces sp. AS02]MCL8009792.1 hypothetical protein [Streptomyces sp. AS02]
MDTADLDAQRLPNALWSTAGRLRTMAYDLFLEHQPAITWRQFAMYGATPGMQVLGVTLDLRDGREMTCGLTVRMSPEAFSVEADIGVDDPENAENAEDDENSGYRYLLEIPEAPADSLDGCLRLIDHRVAQLIDAAPRLLRELRAGTSKG